MASPSPPLSRTRDFAPETKPFKSDHEDHSRYSGERFRLLAYQCGACVSPAA